MAEALKAHQFCLITADCRYSICWSVATEIVHLELGDRLVAEHLATPLHGVVVEDLRPLTRRDGCLWSLAEALWEAAHRPVAPTASFVEGIGIALACRILERQFQTASETPLTPILPPSLLRRLAAHVDEHLDDGTPIAGLARIAGLCPDHFGRLLKHSTGFSPSQFIHYRRVLKGRALLRSGELRIAEVAYRLGFCDQSHFHRHCVRFLGTTPKAILKAALAPKSSKENSESSKILGLAPATLCAFPTPIRECGRGSEAKSGFIGGSHPFQ